MLLRSHPLKREEVTVTGCVVAVGLSDGLATP